MSKTCFRSAGHWQFERSSGFAGYRCQHCATWVYEDQAQICQCDGYKGAGQPTYLHPGLERRFKRFEPKFQDNILTFPTLNSRVEYISPKEVVTIAEFWFSPPFRAMRLERDNPELYHDSFDLRSCI